MVVASVVEGLAAADSAEGASAVVVVVFPAADLQGAGNMSDPKWARQILRAEDRAKIEEALRSAQSSCGAELVPVIVRRSGTVGHVGLSASMLILLGWYLFRASQGGHGIIVQGSWKQWVSPVAEAALAAALGWLLARLAFVQRLFITRHDRELSVDRRARLEFYKQHVEGGSGYGVLLYLSLMERKAVVLCGPHLASKVPSKDWHDVVRLLGQGAATRNLGEGILAAIAKSSELVKAHLPSGIAVKARINDRLIIKE